MAHSRLYKLYDKKEEIKTPFEFARELSNGKFVAELNQEEGKPIGDEMSLEEIDKYIKDNHIEPNQDEE